jgi:N-acetylneuraminate synthase
MMSDRVFVIAEAGVNHNGSLETAKALVRAAAQAGADAVKFQTFSADALVLQNAEKAEYQKQTSGVAESQYEMLKRLELSRSDHEGLMDECRRCGIQFCSTAFDFDSIRFLDSLDIPFMKVPSGEITNLPYLRMVNACRRPVILSTGMATMDEVDAALEVFTNCDVTLLHCTTEYPCPYESVNLRAMLKLKDRFGRPVGYSDHTRGIEVSVAAAALGASVIEKHFTLSRDMEGPDHRASLEPAELKAMVAAIRNVERALGSGNKKPALVEMKNIAVARKSIVAKRAIRKGEIFSEDNLTTMRPGIGISPMRWDDVIGSVASRDYSRGDLI